MLATSYIIIITVYSVASGSPHDAASICLVSIKFHQIVLVLLAIANSPCMWSKLLRCTAGNVCMLTYTVALNAHSNTYN